MKRSHMIVLLGLCLVAVLALPALAHADETDGWTWDQPVAAEPAPDGWTWDEAVAGEPATEVPAPDGWTWDEAATEPAPAPDGWTWDEAAAPPGPAPDGWTGDESAAPADPVPAPEPATARQPELAHPAEPAP